MASEEVPSLELAEQPGAQALRDESIVAECRAYSRAAQALGQQAARLAEKADANPPDLERVRGLPERARTDLVLAVLAGLLEGRAKALERAQSTEGAIASVIDDDDDEVPEVPEGGETKATGSRPSPKLLEDTSIRLRKALDECCERVFRTLVPLVGFGGGRREAEVADLVNGFLMSNCPAKLDLAVLCDSLRQQIDKAQELPETAPTGPDWSLEEGCVPAGSWNSVATSCGRIWLLDPNTASSIEDAVSGLNDGRIWCPDDFCLAVASTEPGTCLGLLNRRGCRERALTAFEAGSVPAEGFSMQLLQDFLESGPSSSSTSQAEDTAVWGGPLPPEWLLSRELLGLMLCAGGGIFDARSRSAMLHLLRHLGVPPLLAARWEAQIGGALFDAMETSNILEAQRERRKMWNRGKVAIAAVGGGLLLAVTGGLAAPAVAAGVTAIGTSAASVGAAIGLTHAGVLVGGTIASWGLMLASMGTAGAAALFGATGAGITGWKLARRWGDLEEFAFEPLQREKTALRSTVEVLDPDAVQRLDSIIGSGQSALTEDVVVEAISGEFVVKSGTEIVGRKCVLHELPDGKSVTMVRYTLERQVDQAQRAVHLTLFVSGWVQSQSDVWSPWTTAARVFFPSSGHLALRWETKQLLDLSRVFEQMVAQEVASSTASFWLRSTAGASLIATGSLAAMAVAWPVSIITAMAGLDNAWLVCVERARLAGQCLARVLADRQTVGQRPVTLIGHSMGARLLVYCLLELHKMGEFNAVADVVLLGTPVTTGAFKWRKVRSVVSGRVINGYLHSDWVLAFLYRYLEWGVSVAGLSKVEVPGIENVDLTDLGVAGHHDYPQHITNILAKVRISEQDVTLSAV